MAKVFKPPASPCRDAPAAAPMESYPTGECTAGPGFSGEFLVGVREVLEAGMPWERALAMFMGFVTLAKKVDRDELEVKTAGVLKAMKGDIDYQIRRSESEEKAREKVDEKKRRQIEVKRMKDRIEARRRVIFKEPKQTGESR